MRALIALLLSLWLAPAWAQLPMTGAGKGTPAAAYQGPGDVFTTSPYAWYSCARGFSAAYAAPGTNGACDVVDAATGLITCTYHVKSDGFVDQAECNGAGQACETACRLKKAYDQTGNGRDVSQITLASMPTITFNSTPKGTLPAITCSGTLLIASNNVTQAQPLTVSTVYIRTSGTALGGAFGSASSLLLGSTGSANSATLSNAAGLTKAATDNQWHSLNGLANGNGTSSAINVDGSDTTGAAGTLGLSGEGIRFCRATTAELIGSVAEGGIWAASSTSTDRNNISSNQHHATYGYNF